MLARSGGGVFHGRSIGSSSFQSDGVGAGVGECVVLTSKSTESGRQ